MYTSIVRFIFPLARLVLRKASKIHGHVSSRPRPRFDAHSPSHSRGGHAENIHKLALTRNYSSPEEGCFNEELLFTGGRQGHKAVICWSMRFRSSVFCKKEIY